MQNLCSFVLKLNCNFRTNKSARSVHESGIILSVSGMSWLDKRDVGTSLFYPGRLKSLRWNTRQENKRHAGAGPLERAPSPLKQG